MPLAETLPDPTIEPSPTLKNILEPKKSSKKNRLKTQVWFSYKTKNGQEHKYKLTIENGLAYFNDRLMSSDSQFLNTKTISKILRPVRAGSIARCQKNYFRQEVWRENSQYFVEQGCLKEPRFKELSRAYSELKKVVVDSAW